VDRLWERLWDRYSTRYLWAISAVGWAVVTVSYGTIAVVVVAYERSDRYPAAMAVGATAATALVLVAAVLPGVSTFRLVHAWARGEAVDRAATLEATFSFVRGTIVRTIALGAGCGALVAATTGAVAGASGLHLVELGTLGSGLGIAIQLISVHSFFESSIRPARLSLAGDTDLADSLPRSRPTFASWASLTLVASAWLFAAAGATFAVVFERWGHHPLVGMAIATGLTIALVIPITLIAAFVPALRPIRDLAEGTTRVAAGDYSARLPVAQDDDLGALAASFNRMQAGLAERERLQAAFGSYVDPTLAARLLEQGDETFSGERRSVSVLFVDIRDFTPFAESHTAEDTVAQLNALFGIVVPAVVDAGGHVNKFLGDGALAVFGAPNGLSEHADAAVATAVRIQGLVAEHFGGMLRVGIGINSGEVIAGTIGGGGKLEFTLIGDTVNVAARVEQLTKATGDPILLTQDTLHAMTGVPDGIVDRGAHPLKGKAAPVQVFAVPSTPSPPSTT
jgi:class 3 adenylate cyclase